MGKRAVIRRANTPEAQQRQKAALRAVFDEHQKQLTLTFDDSVIPASAPSLAHASLWCESGSQALSRRAGALGFGHESPILASLAHASL
jgi:hypothetical protein